MVTAAAIAIVTAILALLYTLLCHILFWVESFLSVILDALYSIFEVFAGITTIKVAGERTYLLNAFLSNGIVSAVYKGMALIGIAMTFGFAVAAVIKKSFDSSGEKVKATYGMIIGNVLKAILLILLMTAIVSATVSATGVLMRQITYVFDNAEDIADPSEIYFDSNDYATMFRILDTIGNYSLNSAYNSRYNINSCFNAIRPDLQQMENNKIFNFSYDEGTAAQNSWQAAILKIYNSASIDEELPIDLYNESVTNALLDCVDKLQHDGSFKPLSYYKKTPKNTSGTVDLGRMVMVISSFDAAWNSKYNKNPSLYDSLRGPYMNGSKNIYSLAMEGDFCLSFGCWNHILAVFLNLVLIWEFLIMLINCTARIFNIIILYITAPFFASVMPLDDGGKMKQWTTAFVIQSLSIFGSVVAVRLLIIFIPIIMGGDLQLFESSFVSMLARVALLVGMTVTAEKASGMISGILADNAGYQSIMAGDVGAGIANKAKGAAGAALKLAGKGVGAAAKAGADATGLTTKANAISDSVSNKFQAMREKGGFSAAKKSGWKTKAQEEKESANEEKEDQKKFRQDVRNFMDNSNGNPKSSSKDGSDLQSSSRPGMAPLSPQEKARIGFRDDTNIQPSSRPTLTPPPSRPRGNAVYKKASKLKDK